MASASNKFIDTPYHSSPHWDVFLSFYGKDTRRNFVSHLYYALELAGILTFRDDPGLSKGEEISSRLLNAIRNSKKFIVVLSENYARSPWCLEELAEILSTSEGRNIPVIPIFYHVDPSNVRHQKGSFGEALQYHKKRYSVDVIDNWKYALAAIGKLRGYHLQGDSNESEAIMEIVDEILPKINPKTCWDVFLSFCSVDTRYTFSAHLYSVLERHGLQTYKGDPELHSGDKIPASLLQAIKESKMYIVVISGNFASSYSCLDELVQILECCTSFGRLVVPLFYNIEPSVVRHQTGCFRQAFEKHESHFDMDRLAKWRATLMNVATISGYQVRENMYEADIINKVVDRVLLEINPRTLDVAKYPVGLGSRVRGITTLLDNDIEGITRIGIHGMGGVGKTTLAKAVYNQNYHRFQGSCFLENVREVSRTERGLVSLQQKLICDVLKCKNINIDNIYQGIVLIRARICSKQILIVIDDLDNPMVLDFLVGPFASGSTTIITTRNEDLLDSINVEARYKVNELGDTESRRLFSQHAFGDNEIPHTFTELSQEILERAGGLPLALNIFGSNLLNQSKDGVISMDRLEQLSSDDVEKNLQISFDSLKLVDPMLQDIFLDIACFFVGWIKEEVVRIMETCYTFVNDNIDILKKRCLLTINDRDELEMHDLLRDMGREIARNGYLDDPGKHSRLWKSQDIYDVLKEHKGTEAIEGIVSRNVNYQDGFEGESFSMETFKKMSKLRFLYLKKINLTGSFDQTFEDLRWLFWDNCPLKCLPSDFYPEELAILELPYSKMTTMWESNNVDSRVFEKLKTLNMSYSVDLITTPDFTKLPCLETLNFEGCKSLEEVNISIESLTRLVSLNLRGCVNLRSIPDSICNLRALTTLNIGGCSNLIALPSELGNIESLTEVDAWGLTVSEIPDSVRRLSKFVELKLGNTEHLETPRSSASDSTPTMWDVFLSFRGSDTRNNFASHLYSALDHHGVRTFRDNSELSSGERISSALPQAIHESKTYIVVFSENYASSHWCLDELLEILNCKESMQRRVIPIYYNIDPVVVRHQTGSFEKAFRKHEIHLADGTEKLKKWRLALTKVAMFSGYHIAEHRSEIDVIKKIVDEVMLQLNPKALTVVKYPIRFDSRVKDILEMLSTCTEGFIRIGIYGVGGGGKTTLAKALYNQLLLSGSFKGSCFLSDVRDISGTVNGLASLQQQLINDVLKSKKKIEVCNVDEGITLIKERICPVKVLVVLDDLDDVKQYGSLIGSFASESVVIITTRDEAILNRIKLEPRYRYRVDKLNDVESLAIFTRHAFGEAKPDSNLMVLSQEIISYASGLPLALKVFGSYLYKRTELEWKSFLEKLQQSPERNIQQKIQSSLDALEMDDPLLKKIFLDIACFFIGKKKEDVVEILGTYYSYVDHRFDILKQRCLLTINKRNELGMHDLLRDVGREIARNNSPDEPEKHSRLWVSEDIYNVLKNNKGSSATEGIIPHNHSELEGKSFSTKAFKRMSKLRFLYLKKVDLAGSFEQIFEDLRWLCWDYCPLKSLPSEFDPKKLVILELPHSSMRALWELNMVSHVFKELKTLNMSYSQDLTSTPDFSNLPGLETLNLKRCESLEEVHISIGSLERLVSLDLHGCVKLRSLPDTICNLRALEVLDIHDCTSLKALPTALGGIVSLKELNAEKLSVSNLPDSIGHLSKLVDLRLSYNKDLQTLPDTIYNLKSLEKLDIGYCSHLRDIAKLPPNLKCISADGCTSIKDLPNLSNLKQLEELDLTDCISLKEIQGLEELTSIKRLYLEGCSSSLLPYFRNLLHQVSVILYSRE
ncbi:hypothetical protein AgCh_039871 [Apium graveolens]